MPVSDPVARPFDTPERQAFRESVERFVAREIAPHADVWDEAGDFPWELHEKAGALGLFGLGIPEEYGGAGFDDAFMRLDAGVALGYAGVGGVNASLGARNIMTGPILSLASEDVKRAVLPEIVSGRVGGALAMTEPSGGSDLARMKTSARREGDDWLIDGEKTFITGGIKAHWYVVGARTGGEGFGGISLFLVPREAPGFARTPLERKMGWWCSDTATLHFDACRVPASAQLGEEGLCLLAVMDNFNYERLSLAAGCLGMARRCLDDAVDWARQRETFGKPLIRHQVIRHKIAEMSARIDALDGYLQVLAAAINAARETGGPLPAAGLAKVKFLASGVAEHCASEAMQVLGGAGYLRGCAVERIYREVKVMAIGGGSEEIMRDLAVRQMGL
ncbi:acyl-CoA dehydrogenase [Alkalicaulis satelles]|uniref:Acyl-CoA dehydrogenase n=1 Tax=Alkalicaulis satelles TaxID=2609175 RepID=A0A5M6ZJN7_9PROT|nr:acyl-CoA dehydrogenase family protein [Alkalicaulis satelles]KAA5803897.1 acyl-CoA dehydrogenase [Alkalicaulis satelles]